MNAAPRGERAKVLRLHVPHLDSSAQTREDQPARGAVVTRSVVADHPKTHAPQSGLGTDRAPEAPN